MDARDTHVLELRGETFGTITSQSSCEEIFQNHKIHYIRIN